LPARAHQTTEDIMAQVPTRSTFFIPSAFGAPVATTVVSNANPAVVTAAAHGFANGDVVEITSGWGRLNKRYFEVTGVATNTFNLRDMDTTNTTIYPAGTGLGSVRRVTAFTQITTVMNPQTQGGDPRQVTYRFLESDVEFSINDGFAASTFSLELDADSIGTAGYTALKNQTELQTDTCLRINLPNGSKIYFPCTVALNEAVRMTDGQINRVSVVFNSNNRLTRYAN
jgi:hypothetical protein